MARGQESEAVLQACNGYFDAFYKGDVEAVEKYFSPTLYKAGFWKQEDGTYTEHLVMRYDDVMKFAQRVADEKDFAGDDAVKEIEILEVSDKIANVKVKGNWGFDYILLWKDENNWKIEQVIWQGPNEK